jgi:hypothetical protein
MIENESCAFFLPTARLVEEPEYHGIKRTKMASLGNCPTPASQRMRPTRNPSGHGWVRVDMDKMARCASNAPNI